MLYIKKPIIISAVQFTGNNDDECKEFCPTLRDPEDTKPNLIIPTLEGEMLCSIGDYIIKEINNEFYPCKPDIFQKTYDTVVDTIKLENKNKITEEEIDDVVEKWMKHLDGVEGACTDKEKIKENVTTIALFHANDVKELEHLILDGME